jgi:hypothetical protein
MKAQKVEVEIDVGAEDRERERGKSEKGHKGWMAGTFPYIAHPRSTI